MSFQESTGSVAQKRAKREGKHGWKAEAPISFTTTPKRQRPMIAASITPESLPKRIKFEDIESFKLNYEDLQVSPLELRASSTLTNGQCFNWKAFDVEPSDEKKSAWGSYDATEWRGILRLDTGESAVVSIRQTDDTTLYKVLSGPANIDYDTFLRQYFQLNVSLGDLYDEWSRSCPRLRKIAECLPGVRILDQDPWECLISFICSSNNNIPRITKMLDSIRKRYGELLWTCNETGEEYFSFPTLDDLSRSATERDLREIGMGYRAKYLTETMRILKDLGGEPYLQELRAIDNPDLVQDRLCELRGVGRKVADCVALFSLRQVDAIPVDVHVWNIARRDYDSDGVLSAAKSLTPTVYATVCKTFRNRFKTHSGWAHSVLFVAELPSFRDALPESLILEMDAFKRAEKERKRTEKQSKQNKQG